MFDGRVLRRLRDSKGWSQPRLEQESGVSQSTISRYELVRPGRGRVDMSIVSSLAKALGVDVSAFNAPEEEEPIPSDRLLRELSDRYGVKVVVDEGVRVPLLRGRVSAGFTGFPSDADTGGATFEGREEFRGRSVFAVEVAGDCLCPDVEPGDVVYVDVDLAPRDGDLCLVTHEGELMCKRAQVVDGAVFQLVSNREGEVISVNGETRVLGKVVGLYRPL